MILLVNCVPCVIVTDKDWEDIKFGVDNQVDFYAVSFVKDAKVVLELKDYLKRKYSHHLIVRCSLSFCVFVNWTLKTLSAGCNADIHAIVKIESADSIPNLHSIISASDGVSVIGAVFPF